MSRFAQAKAYIEQSDLPESVDTSINACYQASGRYRRQLRARFAIVSVAILALIVIESFGLTQQIAAEQERTSQRATAQAQAEQTAQAESVRRATAQAQAAEEAARAAREAEVANSQRLANQARQLLAQGNRPWP